MTISFEDRYMPIPISGCWVWMGQLVTGGYGDMRIKRKHIRAHRYSYEIHIGPIPDGMLVLHRCDVPACINPAHLFIGTHQDNSDDKLRKGRQAKGLSLSMALKKNRARGRNNCNNKLSEEDVMKIFNDHEPQRAIAKKFGVSQRSVAQIKLGVSWSWLTQKKSKEAA